MSRRLTAAPNQKDRLGNAALKPSATDVAAASAAAQDLLRLRFSTPLFRLGSADLINAKVGFPVSGTADAHPGVVVMRIDDTVGADVDPALKGVLVVVNASPTAVSQKVPAPAGTTLSLSPVQASGSDAVVKSTTWDPATVPAPDGGGARPALNVGGVCGSGGPAYAAPQTVRTASMRSPSVMSSADLTRSLSGTR